MNYFKIKHLPVSLIACGLVLPAAAQETPTNISVGSVPNAGSGRVNEFATITLTETAADAWSDGNLHLFFRENVEQHVFFVDESSPWYDASSPFTSGVSSATGSVAGPPTVRGPYLIVHVDADDSVIDSITIRPQAWVTIDEGGAWGGLSFLMMDGDDTGASPAGVIPGGQMHELGHVPEIVDIEIGFEEDVSAGASIDLPVLTATGQNTGPYSVSSDNAAVATASVSGDQITVTGISEGQAFISVEDSIGRSDHVIINVLAAEEPAPAPAPEPEPEPEPAPAPAPAPEPEPEPEPAPEPEPEPEPTPQPDPEPAPEPEPDPEPQPTSGPSSEPEPEPAPSNAGGSGGNPDPAPAPAPEPEPVTDPAPDTGTGGTTVSQASAVMGGGVTSARFSGGALAAGESGHRDGFQRGERVRIAGEIEPESSQVGLQADLFTVVKVTTPSGANAWFYQNLDGRFVRWNGRIADLQPARESQALAPIEQVDVYEGALLPGEYKVFFGYLTDGDSLIYSQQPLSISVSD